MDDAVHSCLMLLLFSADLALVEWRVPAVEIAGIYVVPSISRAFRMVSALGQNSQRARISVFLNLQVFSFTSKPATVYVLENLVGNGIAVVNIVGDILISGYIGEGAEGIVYVCVTLVLIA